MKRFLSFLLVILCLVLSACYRDGNENTPPIPPDNPSGTEVEPQPSVIPESPPPKAEFSLEVVKSFSRNAYSIGTVKLLNDEILFTRNPSNAGFGVFSGSEVVSMNRETLIETVLDFQAIDPCMDDTNYYYISLGGNAASGKEIIQKNKSSGEETVLVSYADTDDSVLSGLAYSDGYVVYYLLVMDGDKAEHVDLMCIDVEQGEVRKIDEMFYIFSPYLRPDVSNGYVSYVNVDTGGEWFFYTDLYKPIPEQSLEFDVKTVRLEDMECVLDFSQPYEVVSFYSSDRYLAANNNGSFSFIDMQTGESAGNMESLPRDRIYYSAIVLERYLIFVDPRVETDKIVVYDFLEGTVEAAFSPPEDTEGGGWFDEYSYCEETRKIIFTYRDALDKPDGQQQIYILSF